jgi:metal-dependent amidase/aminoacylase/carboxypeptidase family protein
MSAGPIHNDEDMTADFERITRSNGLNVQKMPQRMSSEDFCWYLEKAPGMIFRFGTRNEEKGCTALAHRSDFRIDEEGMKYAITAFCKYALSYNKE